MFSPADYELAARLLGLPVPRTPAECAAAAPMTSAVLKSYYRAPAPMPGFEEDGINTSATRSLNAYPQVSQPELRGHVQHRLTAGLQNERDENELAELLQLMLSNPQLVEMFLEFVERQRGESFDSGEYLSRQRPAEYDIPNQGGQYSLLNAPASNSIPPSIRYQELS